MEKVFAEKMMDNYLESENIRFISIIIGRIIDNNIRDNYQNDE